MSCELLAGLNGRNCDEAGGVETWYAFARYDDNGDSVINTITIASGECTALTLEAGKFAYPVNVDIERSSFTDTAVGERVDGAYAREQSATIMLNGNTATMIDTIETLCKGRTVWIAKLNDGTYELLFSGNGAKCSDERSSGQNFEDMNGSTLTLTGKETYKAVKIDSAIVLALLA